MLIISFCWLLAMSFSAVKAGMSISKSLNLKVVEVVSCEPLTVQNVSHVSHYAAHPKRNNWPDGTFTEWTQSALETFVLSNPGYVLGVIVKETRNLYWPSVFDPSVIEDPGWEQSADAATQYLYMPNSADEYAGLGECSELKAGTVLHVVAPYGQDGCDTVPPKGICAFDNPMRPVDPDTWKQYGK